MTHLTPALHPVLPRSVTVIGKTYAFKEFMKAKFEDIRYLDLLFNGGKMTKAAWVLPVHAQTEETGTLADFLRGLGASVDEEDLDEIIDSHLLRGEPVERLRLSNKTDA